MKISKLFSLLALGAVALLWTACDDVKEGDRYIDTGEIKAERNVLLLDFTGQNCTNCPAAHEVVEDLEKQYNSDGNYNLVAVAVHSGSLAFSSNYTSFENDRVGLMIKEGNDLMEAWGINTFPRGVIDLTGSSLEYSEWPGAVRTAFEKPSHVNITATANFVPSKNESYGAANGSSGTIEISAIIASSENDSDTKVQMWIVEDNIKARQKLESGTIDNDYIHNNVFRAQVFAGTGNDITLTAGNHVNVEGSIVAKYDNKERWALENIGVIVFVTDKSGVMQVIRIPLTLPEGYTQPEA